MVMVQKVRVLGLDPGSVHLGWCVVDVPAKGVPVWLAGGGETWLGFPTLAAILLTADQMGTRLYAVETMECCFGIRPTVVKALIEAAQIGGYIRGRVEASNLRCAVASSYEWRSEIVGRSNPKGSEIEHAMRELLHMDLPRRTNPHSRDAACLAVYCGRKFLACEGTATDGR